MGRPKGSTNKKPETDKLQANSVVNKEEKVVETKEVDEKAMLEMAEKMAMKIVEKMLKEKEEEKDKEIEELKKELSDKPKKKSNRKYIDENTRLVVRSNISGKFKYSKSEGRASVFVSLDDYGDEATISFEEFRLLNSATKFIKNGKVALVDVYDADYELEDIIEGARLEKIYLNDKKFSPHLIEEQILESDYEDFCKLVDNSKDLVEGLIEVTTYLYKKGILSDTAKVNFLKQRLRNPVLFK